MKVLLAYDKDTNLKQDLIAAFLNEHCSYLNFVTADKSIIFNSNIIRKPSSFNVLSQQIGTDLSNFDRVFCFTNKQYSDNYFLHEYNCISIFSFWGWPYLTNLSVNNGVIYSIIYYFALELDKTDFRHNDTTGCIYDFLWSKDGVDDGMRRASFCPGCLARVTGNISTEDEINLLNDLKILMNLLSNSSKWNQDILSDFIKPESKIAKRKVKIKGEVHLVIASPGDTELERSHLLDRLEIQFRRGNHESHCGKRLIVHGWEHLASQEGYPQDVINKKIIEKMDIVVAVFKHKLGTPTINAKTGKKRALSGTAEELLQALNMANKDRPLGMAYFYSKAPVISIDSKDLATIKGNWDDLEKFKKRIQTKMIYKPYNEASDLLQTVINDIESNIIDNFE